MAQSNQLSSESSQQLFAEIRDSLQFMRQHEASHVVRPAAPSAPSAPALAGPPPPASDFRRVVGGPRALEPRSSAWSSGAGVPPAAGSADGTSLSGYAAVDDRAAAWRSGRSSVDELHGDSTRSLGVPARLTTFDEMLQRTASLRGSSRGVGSSPNGGGGAPTLSPLAGRGAAGLARSPKASPSEMVRMEHKLMTEKQLLEQKHKEVCVWEEQLLWCRGCLLQCLCVCGGWGAAVAAAVGACVLCVDHGGAGRCLAGRGPLLRLV